ncbi:hypothetical protein SAMN06265349_102238 [Flavobacterium resistens]|uniref:Uncharacterized protein n=1 Tax=Flavobacterium resistens TaxID=443612 RepID=A0A521C8A3_9FLAO|nr:hypothetical protein SAMN06265349_102238 [Flavobacterium resistens]
MKLYGEITTGNLIYGLFLYIKNDARKFHAPFLLTT